MKVRAFKKAAQWLAFLFFILLGVGQMPTVVGRLFLVMALMAIPAEPIRGFVDEMLLACSKRYMWYIILSLYLFRLPMGEIAEAGRRMGAFLQKLLQLSGIA